LDKIKNDYKGNEAVWNVHKRAYDEKMKEKEYLEKNLIEKPYIEKLKKEEERLREIQQMKKQVMWIKRS